jgi:hypothetical protein
LGNIDVRCVSTHLLLSIRLVSLIDCGRSRRRMTHLLIGIQTRGSGVLGTGRAKVCKGLE